MLKYRILSAAVLVPLVIFLVLQLSNAQFAFVLMFIMALAAWEWGGLLPLSGQFQRVGYAVVVFLLLAGIWQFAKFDALVWSIHWLAFVWWVVALVWISLPDMLKKTTGQSLIIKALIGGLLFASTWLGLVELHSRPDNGPYWVLFLLILIWVADTGAYFSGRAFGKNKLAPAVSPGKTWEGVYGALIACFICAWCMSNYIDLDVGMLPGFLLVCMLVVMFSIVGDLLESLLKRHQGIKDSSQLIPGHGGILDRIDSLLAAAPLFSLGLHWIQL
ncbi:MAG: phosphatidate cytidylyltransferase [Gammaproteobacteria bacterium]